VGILRATPEDEESLGWLNVTRSVHSTVATTQNHYIKTASPDAIAAMKRFRKAYCAPLVLQMRHMKASQLSSERR